MTNTRKKHSPEFKAKVALAALFDMIFNVGGPKLIKKFAKMNAAIREENWTEAARQSNRPQVPPSRNAFVRKRFMMAAGDAVGAAR